MKDLFAKTGITFAALVVAFVILASSGHAATSVVLDDNIYIEVPDGWEIQLQPKGFNTAPFDIVENPTGKLDGFGGWPVYDHFCPALDFSPVPPACVRPTVAVPQYDFYDSNNDGVIDYGRSEGCQYDPLDYAASIVNC